MQGNWESVTKGYAACPICGKPDWCQYIDDFTKNRRVLLCHRTSQGSSEQGFRKISKNGAGVFWLALDGHPMSSPTEERPLASVKRRDSVYRAMLNSLTLADEDRNDLADRGLTHSEIDELGYRSAEDVAQALSDTGYELCHVPGFYFDEADSRWNARTGPGYFIPLLDLRGKIKSLQMRLRGVASGGRYLFFSSQKRKFTDSSGVHQTEYLNCGAKADVGSHYRPGPTETLFVIEGILKADIAWLRMDRPAVAAVPGVGNAHMDTVHTIRAVDPKEVVIAYDGNWRNNTDVNRHLKRLVGLIERELGIDPWIAVWDSLCGIDDALQSGLKINYLSLQEFYGQTSLSS